MRGRKPKPVEQRIAEGNPQKTRLPEPKQMGGMPEKPTPPPKHLSKDAKAFWKEAVPILHRAGMLDTVDKAALEMASTQYSRFREAQRIIEDEGLISYGAAGQPVEHPAVATERQAAQGYLRFAEQYGLTPVARTRLGLAELQGRKLVDELSDARGKRKREAVG